MSQAATRKGERTKKPPKYMQYDKEADYGGFLTARTNDQKEKPTNNTEINQLARILHRFLSNINQKMKDYHQADQHDRASYDHERPCDSDPKKQNLLQYNEHPAQKPSGSSGVNPKRGREVSDRGNIESKPAKQSKKAGGTGRNQSSVNSNMQIDLDYHSMINQHLRTTYPNISNLSPEMLKGLDIPRQLLEQQNLGQRTKKEDKGKSSQLLKNMKAGKDSKDDLKPFKRQSYHVAIAYHIHLKRIKNSNPTSSDIDPTYPARKLRESQTQQASNDK